jgi:eukaryotic-like serine/threonine-protein kinase
MPDDFKYKPGDRLDDFVIVEPLFSGALADVYQGEDSLTGQMVAIKVPAMDIVNHPLVYYHFQNEIQVLAAIDHPLIVRLIRRDRTRAYSVFEFVPGMDLRQQMGAWGPLSLETARHYIGQIARGLSFLHGCGVIHLDIKPENIIVTPGETVKLVDFGLARQLGSPDVLGEDFTRPHGTPYYAAPEQLERYRDDPRTDLYSLGLVFYEMLTGRLPFEKSRDLNQMRRRLTADPVPPRRYRKEIPEAVETVIIKAISRKAKDRYPSMDAFVRAVEAACGLPRPVPGPTAVPARCPIGPARALVSETPREILAAIDDNNKADDVVEAALHEALDRGGAVTLLTVVAGDDSDDWTRYGDAVRGRRWGRRIEEFTATFRNYGIEPMVRIRNGSPSEIIVETANAIRADLIIMGPPGRRLLKRLFGGRTIDRVLKQAACPVKVATASEPLRFPFETDPAALDVHALKAIDYYLAALWTRELNWFAALIQGWVGPPPSAGIANIPPSPVLDWFAALEAHPLWADHLGWVHPPLHRLQAVAGQMRDAARGGQGAVLRSLYLTQALPLLCRLRTGLQKFSTALREQTAVNDYQRLGFLDQTDCPIDPDAQITGGPMRQIQAIREFFCAHPDATPHECLVQLASGPERSAANGDDP